MRNKATKAEAVRVIQTALKDGWARSVDGLRLANERPFAVQVNLHKAVSYANGYHNDSASIIVSFRHKKHSWIPAIAVYLHGKRYAGLWHASYALQNIRETAERQAARLAVAA